MTRCVKSYLRDSVSMASSSFCLDDDAAERFFAENAHQAPASASVKSPSFERSSPIAQFEVDDSATSYLNRAYAYADLRRYVCLFEVSAADVYSRCLRASVPYCGLFVPPLPAAPAHSPGSSGGNIDNIEGSGWVTGTGSDDGASSDAMPSVASPEPFNTEPDLYGAIWLPITLALATSMGSQMYALIRSVISGKDAYHGTRLATVDFSGLVSATSGVGVFVVFSSVGVYVLKPYLGDPETANLSYIACVYGYR